MRNTPQQLFPAYSRKYIGTPYEELDCWNVVRTFYDEVMETPLDIAGPDRPLGPDLAGPMISSLKGEFVEVAKGDYQFGDILLLRLFGRPVHLGIYLNDTHILHTQTRVGCMLDRYSRWDKMIEGCYRHEG